MKVFKYLMIFGIPLLIVINLFQMAYFGADINNNPRGFQYLIESISHLNFFEHFLEAIHNVKAIISALPNAPSFLSTIFMILGGIVSILYVPIAVVIDILTTIYQILSIVLGLQV